MSAIHLTGAFRNSLALTFTRSPAPRLKPAVLRRLAAALLHEPRQFSRKWLARTCPICGYFGMFIGVGEPPRWDARCPQYGSREHHRLTQLWIGKDGGNKLARKRILHFAPEKAIVPQMRDNPLYEAADLHQTGVTHRVDITQAALPDASYDVVIAHHLLEHVDNDRQALRRYGLLRDEWVTIGTKPFTQAAEHGGV